MEHQYLASPSPSGSRHRNDVQPRSSDTLSTEAAPERTISRERVSVDNPRSEDLSLTVGIDPTLDESSSEAPSRSARSLAYGRPPMPCSTQWRII